MNIFPKFIKNQSGATLVEFVLFLPIMTTLLLGSFEIYRYVYIQEKIEDIATRVANWSAAKTSLSAIQDFFYGAYNLGVEFNFKNKGGIYVTGVQNTSGTNKAVWTVYSSLGRTIYGGLNATVSLPSPLSLSSGQNMIIVEVNYQYTPVTSYFSFLVSKTLSAVAFAMPRGVGVFYPLPA